MHPLPQLNLNTNNMKKAFFLLIMMVAVAGTAAAQGSKWFVSVVTGAPYGGPGVSMKKNFRRDGLDGTESFHFLLFFGGTTKYPINMWNPPLLLKFGKRLTEKRSWFAVAGLSSSGEAEGYKMHGELDGFFPIFASTSGTHVTVKYQVLQFGAGYQYHYAKTRTKLSVAPSLFVYKYKNTRALQKQQYAAIRPGMAFSGRLPLGKEKKLFGVDVIADLNLVPPVKMKALSTETITDSGKITTTLNSGSVNLVHGMLGFAFSLRR
jgi:hypothetical protein